MLSPRYLAGLSEELVEIYSQLETDILCDMARRLSRVGKITEMTEYQARTLVEAGLLKQNIARVLKNYDKRIVEELTAIFSDAMIKNVRADNRIFKEETGRTLSDSQTQVMLASIKKVHSDLSRLTLTTAETGNYQFIRIANRAYMNVASGAFNYNSAIKQATDELAKEGLHTRVTYSNQGKNPVTRSIEAAVRMNVLTGVNQTAAAVSLTNCDELECDLVEVTAHLGARPSHEAWQGKIYKLHGSTDKYPNFYEVCRYGEADGICGVNCRHSFYPYFEGQDKHYTQDDLDELSMESVTYNGKEMTHYEGEQQLRHIERNIRFYKKKAAIENAANLDNSKSRIKIGEWQARARNFTKETGIMRDTQRERIGMPNGNPQPRGVKPKPREIMPLKETKTDAASTTSTTVRTAYSQMSDNEYRSAITKCAKSISREQATQIDQHEYGGRMRGYVRTANSRIINRAIKNNGIETLDAEDRKTVEALRSAISKNVLKKDTVLIRNIKPQWLESRFGIKGKYGLDDFKTDIKNNAEVIKQIESLLPNKIITENKFLSCSTDAAKNFFNSYGVTIEIHAPKGTHCYFPDNTAESECILDIGHRLKVISATVNADRVNVICEIMAGD